MPNINRYPRGYIRPIGSNLLDSKGIEIIEVASDPELANLYKLYMSRSVNRNSWDYRALVIKCVSRLFSDFRSWLYLQITANDAIYGLNLEFLKDTLLFIRTGERELPISSWLELLLEHPDENHGTANMARAEEFQLGNPLELDNVIGMWCSHPGGFEDMLCTAHVLFGASKSPKNDAS